MLTQLELEHALDNNMLWFLNGQTGEYLLMKRTGATRPTKNGFTIPATPGNCNHFMLKSLAGKDTTRPENVISATQPTPLPVGALYTLGDIPKALIN